MYLKSLVLKGFKSFADRSVLELEPGISAIVGPNGSGKSNICDAVLWVLGELNPKHLRGQAMEDVIFAGSSARKPVGVAEVDLVLDNSDGTLPVDYDEVAITRRMYRSGESEYLINGTMARRMDVLDILHDSGLGTGTHSIISQGSLESILQSKPEDLRALIEEAAGVLKHKQRKAKSERKLAAMDESLTRVRDIAAEVERQLGPLERKAKRARMYQELSAQLSDLNLALAVDDLRALRKAWNEACAHEQELMAQVDGHKAAIDEAERRVGELQEQLRRESVDAGELARRQRQVSSMVERFDGTALLLREKGRNAQDREVELRGTLEQNKAKRAQAEADRAQAEGQLASVRSARAAADAQVERLSADQAECAEKRRGLERETERLEREKREDERARDKARRELSQTQEALSTGLAHERLIEGRQKELELELERAKEDATTCSAAAEEAREACRTAAEEESAARTKVGEATNAREAARRAQDEARDAVSTLSSQIKGLEALEKEASASDPALAWALEHAAELQGGAAPLSGAVRASAEFEQLVEHLLGAEVSALLLDDEPCVQAAAEGLASRGEKGVVVLVPREGPASGPDVQAAREAAALGLGRALVDELSYPVSAAFAVESLLGDVVVCESLDEAFAAHERFPHDVRFASKDGSVVWPSGKVTVGSAPEEGAEGALARARRLDELKKALEQAQGACDKAKEELQAADEALHAAQTESLARSQELAQLRGKRDAAQADAHRAEQKLASARRELADIEGQRDEATHSVEEARPKVEELEKRLQELERLLEENADRQEKLQAELVPLRKQAAQLRDSLSEAKLSAATLAERESYTARVAEARARDLEALAKSDEDARASLSRKSVALERISPLLADVEELAASAQRRLRALEEEASAAQDSSTGLHASLAEAREGAKAAHDAFDELNGRLSESRVEKGRLEVQVQAAVDSIVKDCGVPIEQALSQPELEDRGAVEEESYKLRRRIANMGTINPDAAEEYDKVKSRYDYLQSQIADLESAQRSLQKIVRAIDERMKDDFMRTYEEVDKNFQEIFGILFPGGSAHLSLVDPDDVENTGVEVSAQPRGKRITKMSLMSGGEKSLTALALLFAVYRTRATPFYILDEVEAALDDTNLRRLLSYLDTLRDSTQLIMITHQRRTMEMADVLFGVSMQADGVTKVISQRLDRALQYAD